MDSSKKYELVKYDRNNLNVRMGLHRHIGQPELVAQVFDDAETTDKRFLAKFGLRTNTSDLNKELMAWQLPKKGQPREILLRRTVTDPETNEVKYKQRVGFVKAANYGGVKRLEVYKTPEALKSGKQRDLSKSYYALQGVPEIDIYKQD